MQPDNETKNKLQMLLAQPQKVTPAHVGLLNDLIDAFPYYQPLHLLLAKADSQTPNANDLLTKAAVYTNGNLLYDVLLQPENLVIREQVSSVKTQIVSKLWPKIETSEQKAYTNETVLEVDTEPVIQENVAETLASQIEASSESLKTPVAEQEEPMAMVDEATPEEDTETLLTETGKEGTDTSDSEPPVDRPANLASFGIENISFEDIPDRDKPFENCETQTGVQDSLESNDIAPGEDKDDAPALNNLTTEETPVNERLKIAAIDQARGNELELEPVAAFDFFALTDFGQDVAEVPSSEIPVADAEKDQKVSRYDDDKLPYTFLWWLAKTRKQHAESFRPYATVKHQQLTPKSSDNPLQQQYVEHIFHAQTPFDESTIAKKSAAVHQHNKSDDIIDSFIKNEPQIKPPKSDQLDNENKAKKSAEDHYDLVSETLASIYIEQMLYHKAIDTYQKLSLKFPEKSGYFADLIQSLEKKI